MQALRVAISGMVQGVGFRYSTLRQARRHGLAGWVRNTAGGGVEAEFQGDREALEAMLGWCRKGPPGARVTSVEQEWGEPEEVLRDFTIR